MRWILGSIALLASTGALLAQGMEPAVSGAGAAYLHGLAARLAADGAPIGASDVIAALPRAFRMVGEEMS